MTGEIERIAAEVERLEGPSRETDAVIALAKGWQEAEGWFTPPGLTVRHHKSELPAFTQSLDAAMTLVPEGWRPSIDCTFDHPEATMHPWADDLFRHGRKHGKASTPALALCAAALKARAHLEQHHAD